MNHRIIVERDTVKQYPVFILFMEANHHDIQLFFEQARIYEIQGDPYNAVKLYKKVVRLAPRWAEPYHFLCRFYRKRKEWKPSLYYSQKAVTYNPEDKTAFQILAIAATALNKWRIARIAWNRLGFNFKENNKILKLNLGFIPVCINAEHKPEIVWAQQIGPARAIIESIPQPSSGKRYKEEILIDNNPIAYRVFQGKRLPVYEELESIHLSSFKTYAVILETSNQNHVDTLISLSENVAVGFDNWSKATRLFLLKNKDLLPEFYGADIFKNTNNTEYQLIALAAKDISIIKKILRSWEIITLQSCRDLIRL